MASDSTASEPVIRDGREYRAVREGLAQILAPYRESVISTNGQKANKKAHNNDEGDQAVFYNPIQQYNRDLSVLAILTYGEGALVEKEAKLAQREKGKKDKKGRKQMKGDVESGPTKNEGADIGLFGKRKAAEVEEAGEQDQGLSKRSKIVQNDDVDIDVDVDDGLEVRQLEIADEVEIITKAETLPGTTAAAQGTSPATDTQPQSKKISFTILDALSASGLRAIRYAKEIPFATNIVANDISSEAVKSIELNIDHNEVRGKVHSNVGDARAYMYSKVGNEYKPNSVTHVHKFDVVDLDPYGTAAPFLDAALLALTDGGLLCVTCTDAGVFASNGYPEKAYSLYNGVTMKGPFSHEAGLRLILHAVATSAAKYSIAIEPLLSLSIDFYVRLFIRVHKQQQQVKVLAGTTMVTYSCDNGCGAWQTQLVARNQKKEDKNGQSYFKHSYAQGPSGTPLCEHCGSKTHLGGPMWAGPLHNSFFVQRILDKVSGLDRATYQTIDRIRGMLTVALGEDLTMAPSSPNTATADNTSVSTVVIPRLPPETIDRTPFFFIPNYLSKVLHCATPPEDQLRGAIRRLGYRVTRSHCKAGSFKTDCPWTVLWEVLREWVRQHAPVKQGKITPAMPGHKIMRKIRGTETKNVADVQDSLRRALEKGVEGKDDLKALLESGLYRLEHPPSASSSNTAAATAAAATAAAATATAAANVDAVVEGTTDKDKDKDVSKLEIVFDAELGREKPRDGLVRYQVNPRANWGPMNRAS